MSEGETGRVAAVAALVVLNGVCVAAEYALVAARRSRMDELAEAGALGARAGQRILSRIDRSLAAAQFGITVATLALGWMGVDVLAGLLDRALATVGLGAADTVVHGAAALAIAFLVLVCLQVVLGDITARSLALADPERATRVIAWPLRLLAGVTWPVLHPLQSAAKSLLHLVGVRPAPIQARPQSAEELRSLVVQARAHGMLNETDSAMLAGVFDFHRKKARDVMRPRTEVAALPIDAAEDEVRETVRRERYSRYPVYRETLDDVAGVFLAKDLWLHPGGPFLLADHVRDVHFVPDTRPAERVLDDLRRSRAHLAVVLDEYGGTAGILTMEDLIEEVIGDIADEYDAATRTSLEANGVLELAGELSLIDVRTDHHVAIPDGDWTTLGGYVFSWLGRLPVIGDRARYPGGELEVVAMDGRRVAAVRVLRAGARAGAVPAPRGPEAAATPPGDGRLPAPRPARPPAAPAPAPEATREARTPPPPRPNDDARVAARKPPGARDGLSA